MRKRPISWKKRIANGHSHCARAGRRGTQIERDTEIKEVLKTRAQSS